MHAGYLKTNCGSCQDQPQDVRDALGCNPLVSANAPAWQYSEDGKVVSYFNCPSLFIPESVTNFWQAYKGYTKNRFSIPTHDAQPAKYIQACDIYEYWKGHFSYLKSEDDARQAKVNALSGLGNF